MKKDSVSAFVHMKRTTPLALYAPVHILDDAPPFLQLRRFLMDGLFLNQKTKNKINIQESRINQKPNRAMSAMFFYGGYFCKENFLLNC